MLMLPLESYFHEEEVAFRKVESIRWPSGPVCVHCGGAKRIGRVTGKGARIALYCCGGCRKQFRVTMGTIFEGSRVPLRKWLQAFLLRAGCKRSISAYALHQVLQVTNKSAISVTRRIDRALDRQSERVRRRSSELIGVAGELSEEWTPWAPEEWTPWVPPPPALDSQPTIFVTAARSLEPFVDNAAFDELLAQALDYKIADFSLTF